MRKAIAFIAAATFAVNGFAILPLASAQNSGSNNPTVGQPVPDAGNQGRTNPGNADQSISQNGAGVSGAANGNVNDQAAQPSGPTVSDSEAKSVDEIIADVADSATSSGGFTDVISYLSSPDQDKAKQDESINHQDLDEVAKDFRDAWKNKYGEDFAPKDNQTAFATFPVYQGNIGENARTAGERIGPQADTNNPAPSNLQATGQHPDSTNDDNKAANWGSHKDPIPGSPAGATPTDQQNAAANAQADAANQQANANSAANNAQTVANDQSATINNNLATVYFPQNGNTPALTVHLDNEGTLLRAWRVELPRQYSAQQLHDNLLQRLTALKDGAANWPADKADAYRAVSQNVFAALLGQSDQQPGAMPSQVPGQTSNSEAPGSGNTAK